MMPAPRFAQPATVADALRHMAQGGMRPLAGGTDVYPAFVGRALDAPLLDLSRIVALRGIRGDAQGWRFGATTTWTDVLRCGLPPAFDALKQAAREVGGEQIQNTATLGGNLCNASPAADGTPVWLALDAHVELQSARGTRRLPVQEFVLGNRRTALAPDELMTAIHVPRRAAHARSVFAKLGSRRYLVISITMVAVALEFDEQDRVTFAGAAVGSCAACAQRLPALEARLVGLARAELANVTLAPAELAPLQPIDDVRASAGYRLDASATLLQRALVDLARAALAPAEPAR
jgi:CO/xanthine dehydrogenase FAD-binding subunit